MKKIKKSQNAWKVNGVKINEISMKIKEKYLNKQFQKKDIIKILKESFSISNEKTIRNIIGILKSNNIIKEIEKNKYIVVTKSVYKYKENDREKQIYNLIKKEFPFINFIVWKTEVLNEFTLHYVMNNYIIIEVEKIAIETIVNLLKIGYLKKYTIITQKIFVNNRELYANTENLIIIKPLNVRSPLMTEKDKKYITIEKIMLDLYVDKLFLQYQGQELHTIYENIFEKYDIDFKKLIKYAKYRTNIKEYKKFLDSLNIPKKYKLKEI